MPAHWPSAQAGPVSQRSTCASLPFFRSLQWLGPMVPNPRLMKRIGKAKVLVIDDWGIAPMTDPERRDLFEVIEVRHGISSIIVATQLPVKLWHENIRDPTIADAILDRIVHSAHKIQLKGESMRKLRKPLTDDKNSGT